MDEYAIIVNEGRPESIQIEKRFRKDLSTEEISRGEGKFGPSHRTSRLQIVRLPDPSFDPATETLTGYGDLVDETHRLTMARGKRPLTAEELDDRDFESKREEFVAKLKDDTRTAEQQLNLIRRITIKQLRGRI